MSDYSSVAPPQTQQNFSQSSAFAAALQRAKQVQFDSSIFFFSLQCLLCCHSSFVPDFFHSFPYIPFIQEACLCFPHPFFFFYANLLYTGFNYGYPVYAFVIVKK